MIAVNCYNIHRDKDTFFRTPFTALDMVEFGTRMARLITNDGEDYAKSETIMDILLSKGASYTRMFFQRICVSEVDLLRFYLLCRVVKLCISSC